ncbi:hypothetical protein CHARACLAT_010769 [Characodon lateralis]|uniref:Uncharacterized protein n=1 Tax=Characodon lateralis TaxID=208331 RepID=A0ABU7E1J5_9TELE|nr:hypothetical protein [Characodon lateralis]
MSASASQSETPLSKPYTALLTKTSVSLTGSADLPLNLPGQKIVTLNFGITLLNTDYVSGRFWTTKITYAVRTSSPNYCFHLDSDQAGSFLLPPFPGPRHKRTLSTLQHKYLHIELTLEITKLIQTAPKKSPEQFRLRKPGQLSTTYSSTAGNLTAPTY